MGIVILGGTGFIGGALLEILAKRDDTIIVSSREPYAPPVARPNVSYVVWDGVSLKVLEEIIEGADAVINLVGENIASKRWTEPQKRRIADSRLIAGKTLVQALKAVKKKPAVLIQASAVGYYGLWSDQKTALVCSEKSPSGEGFLADLVVQWEASTVEAEALGVRRCVIRAAPVLGSNGGILKKILPPFYWSLGSILGTGEQPFPWIHIDDEAAAIVFLLDNGSLNGAFNLVAPEHISMSAFARALTSFLGGFVFLKVPKFALRLALGQMADELLLSGQKAVPEALLAHGFVFKYPSIFLALKQILGKASRGAD